MSSRFDYEKIDVVEFLRGLGVRNVRDLGLEVSYSCPFDGHSKEDAHPSASMSKVTIIKNDGTEYPPTTFNCFTCGRAGTAVTFLSILEDVSPLVARRMIRQQFGMSFKEPEDGLFNELFKEQALEKADRTRYEQPQISEEVLERFSCIWAEDDPEYMVAFGSPYDYLVRQRNFDPKILNDFMIGVDFRSKRIAIPIFDENSRLIGFKGRAYLPDTKPKYLVLGGEDYDFPTYETSHVLFALNIAKDHVGTSKSPMIVREGELNTIALHQHGWVNAVGFSGSHLSYRQAELIKRYASKAILWLDDMDKAKKAAEKIERTIPVYISTWLHSDPAEMNKDDIYLALQNSVESTVL